MGDLRAVWRKAWVENRTNPSGEQVYRVRYLDQEGKKRTAGTFPVRSIADQFHIKFVQYLNDPTQPFPTIGTMVSAGGSSGLDWAEQIKAWAEAGSLKPNTRATRLSRLQRFGDLGGISHTGQVTSTVVDTVCRHLRDTAKQSHATIAGHLRTLNTFFKWLGLPSPVSARIKDDWKPYRQYLKARPHFYTAAEFRRLLSSCKGVGRLCYNKKDEPIIGVNPGERDTLWWQTYLSVLYWMGLRLEEVSHLIWHDIQLDAREVKIQPHQNLPGVFDWSPKGVAVRDLAMPDELVNLLREMRVRADPAVPYVFLMKDRYEQIVARGYDATKDRHLLHCVLQSYKRIRNRAKIAEGDIHDFRRTFVTRWMDEPGVSPRDVQEMAGHQNIKTTLEIYTMMREGQAKKKVRAVYEKGKNRGRGKRVS